MKIKWISEKNIRQRQTLRLNKHLNVDGNERLKERRKGWMKEELEEEEKTDTIQTGK